MIHGRLSTKVLNKIDFDFFFVFLVVFELLNQRYYLQYLKTKNFFLFSKRAGCLLTKSSFISTVYGNIGKNSKISLIKSSDDFFYNDIIDFIRTPS